MPETVANPPFSKEVGDLTFQLLANCQEKEERMAGQFGISVPEFRCLRGFRGRRNAPIGELAQSLRLSPSRLTRVVEGLERHGYVARTIDPHDRRGVIVTLTPKGWQQSEELERRYITMHEEILADIPEELHQSVVTSLRNLLASLTRWLQTSNKDTRRTYEDESE
jgi:DNA-binding MarR family transcriptional regulator